MMPNSIKQMYFSFLSKEPTELLGIWAPSKDSQSIRHFVDVAFSVYLLNFSVFILLPLK